MDVDEEKSAADKEKDKKDEKKEEEVKKEEPLFEILSNPARVMRPQLQVVSLELPAKYKPMKDLSIGGKSYNINCKIVIVRALECKMSCEKHSEKN